MAKVKKKLTPAQKRAKKAAKAERQRKYQWVFMNGKQVRIKRPPTVDGMPVDQFIQENADPIWLHQNELWELMPVEDALFGPEPSTEPDEELVVGTEMAVWISDELPGVVLHTKPTFLTLLARSMFPAFVVAFILLTPIVFILRGNFGAV